MADSLLKLDLILPLQPYFMFCQRLMIFVSTLPLSSSLLGFLVGVPKNDHNSYFTMIIAITNASYPDLVTILTFLVVNSKAM